MKFLLASSLSVVTLLTLSHACSIVKDVTMTFYGYPDNSPPGAGTAYNCGGRNYIAGGTGTYSNPLTFASDSSEFKVCEIIYAPYLKKYLRMEDDCEQCDTDWGNGEWHIDVWTGSSTSNGGQNQINCEDDLTPDTESQSIIRSPSSSLTVNSQALYDGSCHTSDTYSSYNPSTYC